VILDKLFGPARLASVGPSYALSELTGGRRSASGQDVDEESALSLSAVFSGVRLLSELVGTFPLHVYRRDGERSKVKAVTNPAYPVLHAKPNREMTGKTARQTLEWNRLLGGNAFAEIQWTLGGNVQAYWPLEFWRVQIRRDDNGQGDLFYWVDNERRVEPEDMLHVPLVSWDGTCGRSFLDYACESLGMAVSAQEFAATFFGNGSRPGGRLVHDGNPPEQQRKTFRKTWEETHGGPANQNRVAVLWGGWKWEDDGTFEPQKSQLLETRRFSTEEVARWLNIPPHMLRDLTRATFSNIEEQGIDFVTTTINPIVVAYEQEYDRKLLNPPQTFCKHNLDALLRGNSKDRAEFYSKAFGIGALSVNDVLEREDLNSIGELGDLRFVPVNLQPLEAAARLAEGPPEPDPEPTPPTPQPEEPVEPEEPAAPPATPGPAEAAMRSLVAHTLERMARVEANALRRAAEKPARLFGWLDDFYPRHEANLAEALAPVVAAAQTLATPCEPAAVAAAAWCRASREMIERLSETATPAEFPSAVEAMLANWSDRHES
jgi:HK97 family phage portal protein